MGDEAVERQAAVFNELRNLRDVFLAPLGGNTNPRLSHEGRRKLERQRFGVKTCQHDFARWRESAYESVEKPCIAARVVNRTEPFMSLVRRRDLIADRTVAPRIVNQTSGA